MRPSNELKWENKCHFSFRKEAYINSVIALIVFLSSARLGLSAIETCNSVRPGSRPVMTQIDPSETGGLLLSNSNHIDCNIPHNTADTLLTLAIIFGIIVSYLPQVLLLSTHQLTD